MLLSILLITAGFLLLIKGAGWLVNGASVLAKKNNISDLAIGLTVVAFGTSAPELVVNIIASFENHSDIVFGNVIGSNNFNLFMILGIVGLIFPIKVQSTTVWKEIPISFVAVLVLFILTNDFLFQESNILSRADGFILFMLFLLFLVYVYKQLKNDVPKAVTPKENISNIKIWGFIVIGLAGLIVGGKLVVNSAVEIAIDFGVNEKIIGLTIVAVGTSLPELFTSVVAAFKKNSDIAIGNIIGSNIFNVFFILSVSAFVNPMEYTIDFNNDIYLLGAGTLFLFVMMFTGKKKKLDRWEAGILLVIYTIYTINLIA